MGINTASKQGCSSLFKLTSTKQLAVHTLSQVGEQQHEDCSDGRYIRQVQQGDRHAFAPLAKKHHHRVFAAIVRQGIPEALAAELTQEVLFKAYSALNTFRFEASFKTWILRIATNHVHNYHRSRAYRQAQQTTALDAVQERHLPQTDGFDLQAVSRLQSLVQDLPEQLREVMILSAFEQCSYEEIAQVLTIPVGTVRSRLHRARQKIRAAYFSEDSCNE